MENKYYTPKIEEFHVGFRYEHYIPGKECWAKEEFFLNDSHVNIIKYVEIQTEDTLLKVRVKSLDHDDIIEAGWEESKTSFSHDRQYYNLNEYECFLEDGEFRIYYEWAEDGQNLFVGKISNYNKLLEVMGMLGVEREESTI